MGGKNCFDYTTALNSPQGLMSAAAAQMQKQSAFYLFFGGLFVSDGLNKGVQ